MIGSPFWLTIFILLGGTTAFLYVTGNLLVKYPLILYLEASKIIFFKKFIVTFVNSTKKAK